MKVTLDQSVFVVSEVVVQEEKPLCLGCLNVTEKYTLKLFLTPKLLHYKELSEHTPVVCYSHRLRAWI